MMMLSADINKISIKIRTIVFQSTFTCLYIYIDVCMYIYINIHNSIDSCNSIWIYIYISIYIYIDIYIYLHIRYANGAISQHW